METGWSQIPSTSLNQIAQALGYDDAGKLPALNSITDDQIQIVSQKAGTTVASQLQSARSMDGTVSAPSLPAPRVDYGDGSDLAVLIMDLQTKISNMQISTAQKAIEIDKDATAKTNDDNLKKIQDSIKKLEDSATSGLLGKIFGWIGAALAFVAAAAAVVVTGGAAAPIVGLVVAGLAIGLMAAQQTGAMDKLMTSMFGDNDKAKMIFQIALQAVLLVASIATVALSGGTSAASAVSNLTKMAQIVQGISQVGAGVSSVAGGAAGIASGVQTYQATQLQADSKDLQAYLAKLQEQMDQDQDVLKKILADLQQGTQTSMDMLNSVVDSKQTIMQFSTA